MCILQADEAADALCVLASSFTAVVPRPCARGNNGNSLAASMVRLLQASVHCLLITGHF